MQADDREREPAMCDANLHVLLLCTLDACRQVQDVEDMSMTCHGLEMMQYITYHWFHWEQKLHVHYSWCYRARHNMQTDFLAEHMMTLPPNSMYFVECR